MNTRKPPLKKRKVEDKAAGFSKNPTKVAQAALVDLSDCSQQQQDSEKLEEKPIKPNGSKMDLSIEDSQSGKDESTTDDEDSEDLHEDILRMYRDTCKEWLLDNGKAFFHVEALSFLRDQNRKQTVHGGFNTPRKK